ncbi:hypothetical protein U737_22370 [Methylomonas sp. LW13]|uniref:hypothetical protein n=1 Tax=unclassified Methylomonas TaxID=2608980 RepID=UPI00051B7B95|nr:MULTISPECIES: hypothetical protein [unclassified Methylomonas]PKD39920.1 hypothetical protein CWO84_13020 [Methylomonas sp. Kb3]QBC29439.1 hypothetical protein U737_22370 [Methylomonas sp. LW13]
MLSNKVINYFKANGWWYEDIAEEYSLALIELDIDLDSEFAEFYLHVEDGPTFSRKYGEIYQICWFVTNSSYDICLQRTHNALGLPMEYIPLDSFEGGGGFFYNRNTREVLYLELGKKIEDFLVGKLMPQWKDFNDFLEWFFL